MDKARITSITSTADVKVPEKLIDQIIGQDSAVEIVKKAAKQKRNVLLIGTPGTGKSMMAQAMAELMPAEDLEDVLVYPNPNDENQPQVRIVPTYPTHDYVSKNKDLQKYYSKEDAKRMKTLPGGRLAGGTGLGRRIVSFKGEAESVTKGLNPILIVLLLGVILYAVVFMLNISDNAKWFVVASVIGLGFLYLISNATAGIGRRLMPVETKDPKLLVDNTGKHAAPFVDATGTRAGALLGDVKHDPLQCIPGDEIINLKNGKPVRISELVDQFLSEGEKELKPEERFEILGGYDDRYCYTSSEVSKVYKRKFEGQIYEIETRRGHKIRVTPNHPLAIIKPDGTIGYMEAERIDQDASLVLPYRLPICKTTSSDLNFITFVAYLLADGYFGPRTVGFKLKRQFKIDEIERCLKANNFNYKKRVYRGATILNVNSSSLVKKLIEMGVKKNNRKSIPPFIFDLDKEKISHFISSYMSLDGYVNKQGQFELFSKELIDDFVPLFLKVGVRAKIKGRIDPGFGKEKKTLQKFVLFNNYEFASKYYEKTINPYHKNNLKGYLESTKNTHVAFDDEVPISFEFLEQIRGKTGLSQTKVHDAYYALKPGLSSSQNLTRQFLSSICLKLLTHTNCPDLFRLKNISDGSYSFDKITSIKKKNYSGYVYNLTTETGNYLVNNVLTHNSGGLGTPAHLRVEAGAIHRANKGVLFIDEIASLKLNWQQELLTAMQEKKYTITGQSEMSSGALVKSQAVPSDFVLVAAGNLPDMQKIHPALRSRIRGAGYEIYVEDSMDDTPANEAKLIQFIAQEVKKDGKIPHFLMDAVDEIVEEARRMSGRRKKFTLNLRELGGLVRAAGDTARSKGLQVVTKKEVLEAKTVFRPVESQLASRIIEQRREYQIVLTSGSEVGRVNGLAVLGDSRAGLLLPMVAEVTPPASKSEGKIIATGKLGTIAKEAVENVSAIIKKYVGADISRKDIHIQFLQTYEGVEGDSASIATAVAVISAITNIPVLQDCAMTGSLDIRGSVLPVGGVTAKIEAAIENGMKRAIIPDSNKHDVYLSAELKDKIQLIPVKGIVEVLKAALKDSKEKDKLISKMKKQ
ncbi:MAG: ATP-dependent protease LonB [Candidatus Micrarchaeota archaeon]